MSNIFENVFFYLFLSLARYCKYDWMNGRDLNLNNIWIEMNSCSRIYGGKWSQESVYERITAKEKRIHLNHDIETQLKVWETCVQTQ